MKIVTTNHWLNRRFSVEKSIEMIAKAGFDGVDFDDIPVETEVWQSSYKDYAKHLRNVAESFGVEIRQTHAPITGSVLAHYNGDLPFNRIFTHYRFKKCCCSSHSGSQICH